MIMRARRAKSTCAAQALTEVTEGNSLTWHFHT